MTKGEVTFLTEVSRDVRAGKSVSDYKVKVAVQILIDHAIGQRQNPIYDQPRLRRPTKEAAQPQGSQAIGSLTEEAPDPGATYEWDSEEFPRD